MIQKYEIKVINNEEILYIYLNFNYEFSKISFNKKNKKELSKTISEYLKDNHIIFKGNIVTIVVGSLILGNIVFNNHPNYSVNLDRYVGNNILESNIIENKTPSKEDNIIIKEEQLSTNLVEKPLEKKIIKETSKVEPKMINKEEAPKQVTPVYEEDKTIKITLLKSNGSIENIPLEEYLVGVVGAEMPALFNIEALKAQAIISRTYAIKKTMKGEKLKDNESNQSYKTKAELENLWNGNFNNYYEKIKKAVEDTKGLTLVYNGNYIEAVFHSTSNGKTESSVNVWGNYYPYLVNVDSIYDKENVSYEKEVELTYQELSNKLGIDINKDTEINLIGKTSGNRIETVKIDDLSYRGIDFRNIVGLRSADFDIIKKDEGIIFTTRGYGHGVGLSQYGANGLAKNGYSYETILKHYYPGTSLKNIY